MSISSKLHMLILVLLSFAFIAMHWSSASQLVLLWDNSAYQHCYLLPFVSLYLIWRNRLETYQLNTSVFGLIALAASMLGLYAAKVALIQLLEQIFFVSGLICAIWAVFGDKFIIRHWFAMLFLFLCVPVGDTLIPTLQRITADMCAFGLNFLDIPTYREGMLLYLPAGTFEVARACSGFRFLNAGLALGAVLAFVHFRTPLTIFLYTTFVVAVCILMNGVRAFLTILIAASSEMQYMTGEDHIILGYLLFFIAVSGVYKVATHFETSRATNG